MQGRIQVSTPAVSGFSRTSSDRRTLDHPSRRYLVHLNAPGWNVIGATAPWRPGVAAGHNERVAWTAEPFDADTQDVYVEKLNPANPRQVEDAAVGWTRDEQGQIAVRGRKTPVDFDARRRGTASWSRPIASVTWPSPFAGRVRNPARRPSSSPWPSIVPRRPRHFGGARTLEVAGRR